MNRFACLGLLGIGCYIGLGLTGCNTAQQPGNPTTSNSSTAPSTASTVAISPQTSPTSNSTSSSASPTVAPSANRTPVPATAGSTKSTANTNGQQFAALKPPLTTEKLKNAEYYFLAKGPIKLAKGSYEDKETKRTYTMSDVVAYGDINKDGIKDAVTALKVTIPNSGNFSYLVALVNEAGAPKNISTEFMGPGIKVKTLKVNADNSIEAVMDQYQVGDPECCPSLKITRTYKLKSNQAQSPQPGTSKK